jgi:hypothetical protein
VSKDVLAHIAETAHAWSRRADLPATDRSFATEVGELAAFLSVRLFPHAEDVDALRVLGCRLCRRVGAANCDDPAGDCHLKLRQLN